MSPTDRTLRLALAQIDYTIGDLAGNFDQICEAAERARNEGADLAIFSECALLGYPPRDMVERPDLIDRQLEYLRRVAALSDDEMGVVVGYIDRNASERGKRLRNAAALCVGGGVVGRVFKRLLPTYDVFDEDRYFEPGRSAKTFEFKGVELGISVCEDAWNDRDFWERPLYACDPIEELVEAGAELLINIAASPFHVDKGEFRRRLISSHTTSHERWMVFVNQVGGHDELIFDGRSLAVSPAGEVSLRLAEFDEDFSVCDIDVDAEKPSGVPRLAEATEDRAGQARRALVLGIRDYFYKSGFKGAVLGLSGGVDSSLTAALAVEALGAENVLGVSMPTGYTRDISKEDARILADNLGVQFEQLPIESTFGAIKDQMQPVFEGLEEDETEENLQARIRGMTLMALANKFNKLVLVPSNKSELAVGYSTLYGDLVGALSPLGDCLKGLVYAIARQINADAGTDLIPERTLTRPPSAELKPDQTDQDTLPPYDTLDPILDAYIHEGRTAEKIVEQGFDAAIVERVLTMVSRAEYKRWQAAPILKITPKAFGVGWRYPLAASYATICRVDEPSEE